MNQIRLGDCRDVMRQLIAEGVKVQCVVTSPPYWGLRDYGIEPSIWGGDPACKHEWDQVRIVRNSHKNHGLAEWSEEHARGGGHKAATIQNTIELTSAFCTKCDAWRGCLGLEPDYRMYVDHMVEVFSLVWELLRDDGTLWLNLGDTYISDGGAGYQGKHGERYARTHTQRALLGNRVGAGLKNKDLAMMPHRTAIAMQDWGWWVRSDIVWNKPNPMPESGYDRPTKAHEYIFLMAKGAKTILWRARDTREWSEKPDLSETVDVGNGVMKPRWRGYDYLYDHDAIKEPASPNSHARMARARSSYAPPGQEEHRGILGPRENQNAPGVNPKATMYRRPSGWDESNGSHREMIGRYPRPEKDEGRAEQGLKESAAFGREAGWRNKQNPSFSAAVVNLVNERNKRSVWTVATSPYKEAHFATFPPALIEPCILAGSRAGDIVFDPFMGSGTVAQVAQSLGRLYLGSDINPAYKPMQERRVGNKTMGLAL